MGQQRNHRQKRSARRINGARLVSPRDIVRNDPQSNLSQADRRVASAVFGLRLRIAAGESLTGAYLSQRGALIAAAALAVERGEIDLRRALAIVGGVA